MKTFKDFVAEANKPPSFKDTYNNKVSKLKQSQQSKVEDYKKRLQSHPTHLAVQKIKDDEEHENYVNSIRKQARKEVKKEYGIDDDD